MVSMTKLPFVFFFFTENIQKAYQLWSNLLDTFCAVYNSMSKIFLHTKPESMLAAVTEECPILAYVGNPLLVTQAAESPFSLPALLHSTKILKGFLGICFTVSTMLRAEITHAHYVKAKKRLNVTQNQQLCH